MARKRRKKTDAGLVAVGIKPAKTPDYVVVELKHDCCVGFAKSGFGGPAAVEKTVAALNKALGACRVKSVGSHLGSTASQVKKRVTAAPSSMKKAVTAEFAHAGFVQIVPRSSKDAAAIAKRFDRLASVWKAHVETPPVPAGAPTGASLTSRNFEPTQGYLDSAPNGIGAMAVWKRYRAKGRGITICDIEGNWNFTHEDLPRITKLGGTLIPDIGWKNHGTAVMGEMVSKPGTSGTVGISHQARPAVHSFMISGISNPALAIVRSAQKLRKGDVILIELQRTGPNGKYVAMQYWNPVFSAIRYAVARGITVVEAAGNGNENFNLPIFKGTGLQRDSGAIVVGAGIPPTNWFDYFGTGSTSSRYGYIGVPRSRTWFSNYGKIVNVQAWGWHVTSCGYGDAQGGPNQNRWYTLRFSGTSSASPIVTGSVACIQGRAKAKRGAPLSPAKVRSILMATGTPQQKGPGVPLSQHIGPQPNLPKAMLYV